MDSAEPALLGASASESAGVTPLRDRLDDLLEEYLILLNEYNVARHNLCASLSSVRGPLVEIPEKGLILDRGIFLLHRPTSPTRIASATVRTFTTRE